MTYIMHMESPIYNTEGNQTGKVQLPEQVFGVPWNNDLVSQVVVAMQANMRTPVAHTKDRSEVRGGGRKPWRQKGTGRARHGSSRSPIWRGGGVTHGPRNEKDFSKKINKKMRTQALYSVLSQKLKDGEILFLESMLLGEPKSADAKAILTNLSGADGFSVLSTKRKNVAFIALSVNDVNVKKSFSNFGNVEVDEVRNLNVVDVLSKKFLIFVEPQVAVQSLLEKTEDKQKQTVDVTTKGVKNQ
jgi:large subunit ribosomal protein L4